jgi:hypothetical protein
MFHIVVEGSYYMCEIWVSHGNDFENYVFGDVFTCNLEDVNQ